MNSPLLTLRGIPTHQNRVFERQQDALQSPRGDVTLAHSPTTGVVFNTTFDPSLLTYDADYQNDQSHSTVFRSHVEEVVSIVEREFSGSRILEVGAGKGYFVDQLRQLGLDARGIDPAYQGSSPHLRKCVFSREMIQSGDCVVLRHVLEHIADPFAFLREICFEAKEHSKIYIEVPSFEWIIQNRAWFDICYEHVNYFRLSDFQSFFSHLVASGRLFGGQYLYVVSKMSDLRTEPAKSHAVCESLPEDFFQSLERCVARAADAPAWGVWGAGAKGVMFAHALKARGVPGGCLIDINPAKQGKHVAGSGMRVDSPEKALRNLPSQSAIFVMNPNYLSEIKMQVGSFHNLIEV